MIRLAVLISDVGRGSNLQAIIDAVKSGKINGEISVVISDTAKAFGVSRARRNNFKVEICPKKNQLKNILDKYNPDYIVLAGWKQVVTYDVLNSYKNQILNLHPGLIPNTLNGSLKNPDGTKALWNRGLLAEKAVKNFIESNSTYAGSSIHFLSNKFDFGSVLDRVYVRVKKNDTVSSLYKRLKIKENQMYTDVIAKLAKNEKDTVIVIDGGGRAAILAAAYVKSKKVKQVIAIPGNDLMIQKNKIQIFPKIATTDVKKIIKVAKENNADLVDVAQDDAVAVGLVDSLLKNGVKTFGPTKSAGQLEWDKAWSRNFMKKFNIPFPKFKVCKNQKQGTDFIKKQKESEWFIKASGLAAGKGALFAKNNKEAIKNIKQMKNFGEAGKTYLVEQCLKGEEFSSFAIVSGKKFEIIGHAQDHKTVFDDNRGPNTGGMGCSSPPLAVTKKIENQINLIFKKTVNGLYKLRRPYTGILYLGGMILDHGKISVIEFNSRWGDPEAQVLVPAIKNDFYELISNATKGKLQKIKKDSKYRVVIAATSKGYPGNFSKVKGKEIKGLDKIKVYGAGVKVKGKKFIADGGRLFYVLGEGTDVAQARKKAYNMLSLVSISSGNLYYRTDIGYRDLNRINAQSGEKNSIY